MNVETLNLFAGALLTVALEYSPYLSQYFEKFTPAQKKQIVGISLIASALLIYGLGCYSPYQFVECSATGFWEVITILVKSLLFGVAGSQPVHLLTKRG